jgi:16S rRNA (adenine1518-N6/adenine1519-N6)-dimethyltransferase
MAKVTAKKHLGQHFLVKPDIAFNIANCAIDIVKPNTTIIEIGPGTGALTKHLEQIFTDNTLLLCEIDRESIAYLKEEYGFNPEHIITEDILQYNLESLGNDIHITGNFPYNISTQIMFKIIENIKLITGMHGMFQKEVAERICAQPGSKTYGILSVLIQAYFKTEYCFTVEADAFDPPPKVQSGVMKMERLDESLHPDVPYEKLKKVVKTAFGMRRKMLRNSLKEFGLTSEHPMAQKRPEQLSVTEFCAITKELL